MPGVDAEEHSPKYTKIIHTMMRGHHAAILLSYGKVLIAGGSDLRVSETVALDSSELYNPATGRFIAVDSMREGRLDPAAALLTNGQVLIVNRMGDENIALNSAELWITSKP
ncbi:hypothetical protein ACFLX9_02455 [Chloroflexota bacterium]